MIFEKIRDIIAKQLEIEIQSITLDSSFISLNIDSLELFQIIIEIEEAFNIQIEDAEAIKTVSDAVKFVEESKKN